MLREFLFIPSFLGIFIMKGSWILSTTFSKSTNNNHVIFFLPWLLLMWFFVVVQSLSHVWLFAAPWTTVHQAFLSFTISLSLPKLMYIELMMPSNHLILCRPLFLLPSIFPNIRVFSNKLVLCIRWPKYWSFSFIISPSNENSGLISFRIQWFDLLAVQGTQESSPAPQFESISSLALSLLYSPTLTSVHDYWKKP